MNIYVQAVATVVVAALTYLGAHQIERRRLSGSVGTSEAATLWSASQKLLGTVLAESTRLRDEVKQLREDMVDSFNASLEVRVALDDCKQENSELRAELHELRNRVAAAEGGRVRRRAGAKESEDDPKP